MSPRAPKPAAAAGSLAIVLHSHMPYVEGFGTYPFGEEWLFDAVARSYLPLLETVERLTMSVTPVLADQLEAPGVPERLERFIRRHRYEAAAAEARAVDPRFRPAVEAAAARYERGLALLGELGGDVLAGFRRARDERGVELLASAATHAVLPLLASTACRRLQIDVGLRSHRRRFGPAAGFWLPECAYEPGLDALLDERGIDHFCTDQSAHEAGLRALAPIAAGRLTAFSIDWPAIAWLWSADGYPADAAYADFHRNSLRGARPWSIGGEAYDPGAGAATARRHARQFVAAAAERFARFREERGKPGLLVFAIDTELLGNWWWEGPVWIGEVMRLAPRHDIALLTLSEAQARHEAEPRTLRRSSWGEGKDLRTWDSPRVGDITWAARRLELRLLRELGARPAGPRAQRATREMLAAQASDWAFLDGRRQAGDYPYQRATGHARAMLEAIDCARPPDPALRNLAPDLSLVPLLEP